jgi:hypothetical protein
MFILFFRLVVAMMETRSYRQLQVYKRFYNIHLIARYHRDSNCNYFPAKNTSAQDGPSPFFTQVFDLEIEMNTWQ